MNEQEDKVTYMDGTRVRAIRGRITKDDDAGVVITRRDGVITIRRNLILVTHRAPNHTSGAETA